MHTITAEWHEFSCLVLTFVKPLMKMNPNITAMLVEGISEAIRDHCRRVDSVFASKNWKGIVNDS